MKNSRILCLLLACLYAQTGYSAVTIVQCEDEQGNRSFHKACPPGTTEVGKRRVATGAGDGNATGTAVPGITATLYSVPECESCDGVREYLQNRNIAITEKNVFDNVDLQTEMKDLTGKESVPVVVIGEAVIIGFNRTEMKAALAALGFKEPETVTPAQ